MRYSGSYDASSVIAAASPLRRPHGGRGAPPPAGPRWSQVRRPQAHTTCSVLPRRPLVGSAVPDDAEVGALREQLGTFLLVILARTSRGPSLFDVVLDGDHRYPDLRRRLAALLQAGGSGVVHPCPASRRRAWTANDPFDIALFGLSSECPTPTVNCTERPETGSRVRQTAEFENYRESTSPRRVEATV